MQVSLGLIVSVIMKGQEKVNDVNSAGEYGEIERRRGSGRPEMEGERKSGE